MMAANPANPLPRGSNPKAYDHPLARKGVKVSIIKGYVGLILVIVAVLVAIYGAYWIAKTVSYMIFYEDMVKATVREMVKKDSLK